MTRSRQTHCQLPIANCQSGESSATIGNLEEAKDVLLSPLKKKGVIVKANMKKTIEVESIIPDEIEKYPWAGHLGIKLVHKVIPNYSAKQDHTHLYQYKRNE